MDYRVRTEALESASLVEDLIEKLDTVRGVYLSSGVEYPGRYTRWDLGLINPPLECVAYSGKVIFKALNPRGEFLLKIFSEILIKAAHANLEINLNLNLKRQFEVKIIPSQKIFSEEERSLQPTVMTPIRILTQELSNDSNHSNHSEDLLFGFYGALGYELIFEFDPIILNSKRLNQVCNFDKPDNPDNASPLFHLYFPDILWVVDRQKEQAFKAFLELGSLQEINSEPFEEINKLNKNFSGEIKSLISDPAYEAMVEQAKIDMKAGDIFEIVLSRKYEAEYGGRLSEVFKRMKAKNPSPYELFCQFGEEALIGTSPEMFVRVSGKKIESCPISGTIKRGTNAMEDASQILELLNSHKDEIELTMCTDVDRNDKSRLCEPESIRLISRRSIETYSSLFHTVDHVEGILRAGFDGIDGFLSHLWAVTLTGAPKHSAVQIIENMEGSSRRWYGGAVGYLGLNGDVNTAITIRTVNFKLEKEKALYKAVYQVGATLVWDSIPAAEVQETKTKSSPFYQALGLNVPGVHGVGIDSNNYKIEKIGTGYKALMIDNQDSFVHTLAGYFRRFGMEVLTYRSGFSLEELENLLEKISPDLIIHSPGPGQPSEFNMPAYIQKIAEKNIPQFGVCLGLQGIVESFGGRLTYLEIPRHGKTWSLSHQEQGLMKNLPAQVLVGAYHSIIADKNYFPACLEILASNEQGDVMAIRHKTQPIMAVQFHPESILSLGQDAGLKIIRNVIDQLVLEKK